MLYIILEKSLNRILQLDPETLKRLQKLQDRVVKIVLTDLKIEFFIFIKENGLRLLSQYQGVVDTTIRAKLTSLIQISREGATGPVLFSQGVEVSGDPEIGEKVREIFQKIDLDFEEILSRYLGDIAAHEIAWRTRNAARFGKKLMQELGNNIREFCQVEAEYLPTREQLEDFYHQIAQLREDVDRASSRLTRIVGMVKKC